MGFFSGIRRRIKKIIPKEIRPALPFILAATPLAGAAGPLAGIQSAAMRKALIAGAAKGLSDDEAGIKDILRTSTLAAAPDVIGGGLGNLAEKYPGGGIAETALKTKKYIDEAGALKTVGAQAATDFGIKQAELNEKALEQYNADLLSRGIRDKAERRSAIFGIFKNAGYDEDEVNVMLDKYGYKDGGEVMKASMSLREILELADKTNKAEKKKRKRISRKEGGGTDFIFGAELLKKINPETGELFTVDEVEEYLEKAKGFDSGEFTSNLESGVSGLEAAFGQPLGGRRPEPMRIIPGFASGGDVDEVMETEEEIITPDYLMKEEGVEIGEQVSSPNAMDELNSLSLDMFGKPVFELTEEEFEMLKDFASQQASSYSQDEMDMYEQYKYDMNEQRPGMPIMEIDDFLRMELGAARMGVAKGGSIKKKRVMSIATGKLKDYPGIKKILEMNKKGKKRFSKAEGGLMNLAGNEMDLRGGGFVPMGKKERADDVPARLSKNEFVMTADAVRAAGGGSVQKGADLMYDTMKKLEAQS